MLVRKRRDAYSARDRGARVLLRVSLSQSGTKPPAKMDCIYVACAVNFGNLQVCLAKGDVTFATNLSVMLSGPKYGPNHRVF